MSGKCNRNCKKVYMTVLIAVLALVGIGAVYYIYSASYEKICKARFPYNERKQQLCIKNMEKGMPGGEGDPIEDEPKGKKIGEPLGTLRVF